MKETHYYFPHDIRARSDLKIRAVVSEFGLAGYGAWWVVVELLRESEGYQLPDAAWSRKALAAELPGIDVEAFLSLLIESGLLVSEDGALSSPSLLRRMEKLDGIREKRAAAGAQGGRRKKAEPVPESVPETTPEPEEKTAPGVMGQMSPNANEDERLRQLVEHIAEDMGTRYPKPSNRYAIEQAAAKAIRFQKLTLETYRAGMESFLREYAPFCSVEYLPAPEKWLEKSRWLDNWKDLGFTKRTQSKGAQNGASNAGGVSTLINQLNGGR